MEERTELETIGEFGLIERLNPPREIRNESTIIGIGDDAAALKYNDMI